MKKIFILFISLFMLFGCTTTASLTYKIETGDTITIYINTSEGYRFNQSDLPFVVSKGEDYLTGNFYTATEYTYNTIQLEAHNGYDINILERGSNSYVEYLFYAQENEARTEYSYIIYIKNSNTSLQLTTTSSQEFISDCFKQMSFIKE